MNSSDEQNILKIAAKISDGSANIDMLQNLSAKDTNQLYKALEKINHVSKIIRKQSQQTQNTIKENETWAHLQIHEKIGEGGIGKVYRGHDLALNCDVAVKFLKKTSQLYISSDKFLQEARNMAKVRHPHVLAIHGAIIDKGVAGYWSDYLDGPLLSDALLKQSFTSKQQLIIAQELSSALLQIHKNKLAHGDIKPQNVILQPHRGAILLDFGSSRKQEVNKSSQKLLHASPLAMAPEQFDGKLPNQGSDIFSLGLLFWNIDTTKHPHDGKDIEEIKQQTNSLQNKGKLLKGNKEWKKLILSMVARNPQNRPSIQHVIKKLSDIEQKPTKRAKKVAYGALMALAIGISSISFYSSYKTKQANAQTQVLNKVLMDILLKSSPIDAGKDILLIDVLSDAEKTLFENKFISPTQKVFYLTQLVKTYRRQGKAEKAIKLASKLLAVPNLPDSIKLDLLVQKSAALNENKNYQEAEELLLQAIKIKPLNKHDVDVLVSALITLIHTYNESYQLEKVSALLKQAKNIVKNGTGEKPYSANLALVEGNYWEIMDKIPKAFEFYQQAVYGFIQHYGEKNLDVLIAKGAAATVLTYHDESREKGAIMLQKVVAEMTSFLGAEHSSTLIARINLADSYAQLNNPQKALDTIVPYLPNVYQTYGIHGGMTLTFKNMIAGYYLQAEQAQKAENILNDIISIQDKKHGSESEQALQARLNKVLMLQKIKRYDKAEIILSAINTTAHQVLASEDRLFLDIQEYVLWNLFKQGDSIAVITMQELLKKKEKLFGKEDPSTISTFKHWQQMQK
jgi:serine/threonine protein kinase